MLCTLDLWPEKGSGFMSGPTSEKMSEHLSDVMPEQVSEYMTGHMSEHMSEHLLFRSSRSFGLDALAGASCVA